MRPFGCVDTVCMSRCPALWEHLSIISVKTMCVCVYACILYVCFLKRGIIVNRYRCRKNKFLSDDRLRPSSPSGRTCHIFTCPIKKRCLDTSITTNQRICAPKRDSCTTWLSNLTTQICLQSDQILKHEMAGNRIGSFTRWQRVPSTEHSSRSSRR